MKTPRFVQIAAVPHKNGTATLFALSGAGDVYEWGRMAVRGGEPERWGWTKLETETGQEWKDD